MNNLTSYTCHFTKQYFSKVGNTIRLIIAINFIEYIFDYLKKKICKHAIYDKLQIFIKIFFFFFLIKFNRENNLCNQCIIIFLIHLRKWN